MFHFIIVKVFVLRGECARAVTDGGSLAAKWTQSVILNIFSLRCIADEDFDVAKIKMCE